MEDTKREGYRHFAFISYKRRDKTWMSWFQGFFKMSDERYAEWLQNRIETYRLPSVICKSRSDLPKRIRPLCCRDKTDLSGGVLDVSIETKLRESKYLIVICSRKSAKSKWVGKEIAFFQKMGRWNQIIPFIVDGEPHSTNPEQECFPDALLSPVHGGSEKELHAISVKQDRKTKAFVRAVAGMLDIKFDDLWNREWWRFVRNMVITGIVAMIFLSLFSFMGFSYWDYNREKTNYFADYVEEFGVPKGIIAISEDLVRQRHRSYEFISRRGLVRNVRYIDSQKNPQDHTDSEDVDRAAIVELKYHEGVEYFPDVKLLTADRTEICSKIHGKINSDEEVDVTNPLTVTAKAGIHPMIVDFKRSALVKSTEFLGRDFDLSKRSSQTRPKGSANENRLDAEIDFSFSSLTVVGDSMAPLASKTTQMGGGMFGGKRSMETKTISKIVRHHYAYDNSGRVKIVRFLDRDNMPVCDDDGIYGFGYEQTPRGQTRAIVYLDQQGKPKSNTAGVAIKAYTYDERTGTRLTTEWQDPDGKLAKNEYGYCAETREFDSVRGWITKETYLDKNQERCLNNNYIAGYTSEYDAQGRETKRACFGVDGKPCLHKDGSAAWVADYDSQGQVTKGSFFGVDGKPCLSNEQIAGWTSEYDSQGRITKRAYFGVDGKPCLNNIQIACCTSEYDSQGRITKQSYFGMDGEPCLNIQQFSGLTCEYDAQGRETKMACFGVDGEPTASGSDDPYDSWEKTYHENGNRKTQTWFYNITKHPNGCSKWVSTYDVEECCIKNEFFDADGKPWLNNQQIAGWNSENDPRGRETKRFYFGIDDRPCLHKDGDAGWTSEYDEKGRETKCSFFGVDGKPTALRGDDPYDSWDKTYHENGNRTTQTWFYNITKHPNGCSKLVNAYNEQDKRVKIEFFGADGKPCLSNEQVAGWTSEYDALGRETKRSFFGVDGEPCFINAKNDFGYASFTSEYDEKGWLTKRCFFDTDCKPCLSNKQVAGWTSEYDPQGRVTKQSFFGADGKPCLSNEQVAGWTSEYDEKGRLAKRCFFGVDGKPCLSNEQIAGWTSEYDSQGRETRLSFFGVDGKPTALRGDNPYDSWEKTYFKNGNRKTQVCFYNITRHPNGYSKLVNAYNEQDKRVKIEFFDADGKPCLNNEKIAGWTSEYDPQGRETKRSFFGVDGKPMAFGGDNPYDSSETTYHENGNVESLTWFYGAIRHPDGYSKCVSTFDEKGHIVKIEFFGIDGKLCLKNGLVAGWTYEYDEKGQETKRAFFGVDGEPKTLGDTNPFDSWEKTYRENGKKASQKWFYDVTKHPNGCSKWVSAFDEEERCIKTEFFDADGKPCLNNQQIAGWNSEYDPQGRETKRSYFGIDDGLCLHKDGNAGWTSEYDTQGREIKRSFFGIDGEPTLIKDGYAFYEKSYDQQGALIEGKYYDINGDRVSTRPRAAWIDPDGQGARLGIEVGDFLLDYDDIDFSSVAKFNVYRSQEPENGPTKKLRVFRNGTILVFDVSPGKLKVAFPSAVFPPVPEQLEETKNESETKE